MTEIQWLVDVMLNHKLSESVKQKFIARIGEVEANLIPRSSNGRTVGFGPTNGGSIPSLGTTQAPSTIAALERQEQPIPPVAQRIVGGEVNTGNGTKGPRKF